MKKWSEKVVIRCMSDGRFARMHPAGFGVRFPSGPYSTIKAAHDAPMNYWDALDRLGLRKPPKTSDAYA